MADEYRCSGQSLAGQQVPNEYGGDIAMSRKSISPSRRKELVDLALNCCLLFDAAKVQGYEKCYVGKLCQHLLEFAN